MSIKIVGDIGLNTNGNIDLAKKLIDLAWIAGFDYVKFQKRDIDLAVPEHKKNEKKILWDGTETTYYEYKKLMEFDMMDYAEISNYCNDKIKWFASVWDINSAVMMKEFQGVVKIPSALITDHELLDYCKHNYSWRIMSTGMSTEEEIEKAIDVLNPDVIMHCNSSYPAAINELNLKYIEWLLNKYPDKEIGYSAHEYGLVQTFLTVALGVKWIERHITLDQDMWGSDQKSSVGPVGMFKLVKGIRDNESSLGEYKARELFESEKSKRESLRKC